VSAARPAAGRGCWLAVVVVVSWVVVVVVSWVALAPAEEFTGKVVGVADGDTITVLRDRTPIKVRLHGIDCPERGQDFGSQAKAFTAKLVFGQVVKVVPRNTDRYGRTVAEVLLGDGRILNHELVKAGLAWWYRKYAPDDRALAQLEAEARAANRGLWSQPKPTSKPPPGPVIGNRRSRVDHQPSCPTAAAIVPGNRTPFHSAEEAERAGDRAAKDCHPWESER
jgi:micrococcal nuclease